MKIAYFHCFSGISGDMLIGSLIDAGLNINNLKSELEKLNISGFELKYYKTVKNGITGTKVDVIINEKTSHRYLKDIIDIIKNSRLSEKVKNKSIKIFRKLAEAEALIHNTSSEKIHFHEVGSLDAVVDVVGTISGLEMLGVEKVYASKIHTGSGFTKCQHGKIPVPAPATLELLKNTPIYSTGICEELVTPTGAAIITTISEEIGVMPDMVVNSNGYGAGMRNLEIPNLLRISLGEKIEKNIRKDFCKRFGGFGDIKQEVSYMIEVNIDDMNTEFFDYIISNLFKKGAQDVFLQNIQMKKNRPGNKLSVLIDEKNINDAAEFIFKETTTIGLRLHEVNKYMLPYEIKKIKTKYGDVRVKIARYNNEITTIAPEYEDCRVCALKYRLPLKHIYDIAKRTAEKSIYKP